MPHLKRCPPKHPENTKFQERDRSFRTGLLRPMVGEQEGFLRLGVRGENLGWTPNIRPILGPKFSKRI